MKKCNQECANTLSNNKKLSEEGNDLQVAMVSNASKKRK